MSANRLNSQVIIGRYESSAQGVLVGSTLGPMPQAEERRFGIVMQYLGETAEGFVQNHFYKCESRGDGYQWVDVTPSPATIYEPEKVMGTNLQGLLSPTDITTEELHTLQGMEGSVKDRLDEMDDEITEGLESKVDKVEGKGLSEEDFTTREKEKLSSVAFGAQVNNIEEIQINNVTVQPVDKVVNLSMLEGHTYPIGNLRIGQGMEVKHNLIRTVFFAQVRDGEGNVVKGDIKANDTVATILPDEDAQNCTMYIICGGI